MVESNSQTESKTSITGPHKQVFNISSSLPHIVTSKEPVQQSIKMRSQRCDLSLGVSKHIIHRPHINPRTHQRNQDAHHIHRQEH